MNSFTLESVPRTRGQGAGQLGSLPVVPISIPSKTSAMKIRSYSADTVRDLRKYSTCASIRTDSVLRRDSTECIRRSNGILRMPTLTSMELEIDGLNRKSRTSYDNEKTIPTETAASADSLGHGFFQDLIDGKIEVNNQSFRSSPTSFPIQNRFWQRFACGRDGTVQLC